jgi:hypothetical protein
MSANNPNIKTEESKSSLDNINMLSNINPVNSQETIKSCLFIRPLSTFERNDKRLSNIIRSSFEDPSQFFAINSPVQVGTRIRLDNMDLLSSKDKNKKSYSIRNTIKKMNTSTKISVTDTSKSLYTIKEKTTQKNNLMLNKEIIDNNNLKRIFENYKAKIIKNKNLRKNESSFSRSIRNINNNDSMNNLSKVNTLNNDETFPYELFKSLDYQNKRINNELNYLRQMKNISKKLSKKLNKNEEDLLINKVDLFKYKKEILAGLNKDRLPEKFRWNITLRLPPNFKGKREYHVNVNSDRNPFWGVVVERYPKNKELAVKPGYNLKQKEFLKFSKDMNNINKNKNNVNAVKNLDDLNVVGNDLLDIEFKREMSTKGRKILHKAFIENGKAISNQDINTAFGEKTLYKNYENANKYRFNDNRYIKGNISDKNIFMNSSADKNNENDSILYNNFQTVNTKI